MILRILLLIVIASLVSCGGKEKSEPTAPVVSVSILPQKYFVEKIAGELFEVNVMIPPRASPATYEPSPAQISSLAETDLYLKIGYTNFEISWMDKLTSANEEMKIVDLSEGIDLIMEEHHHHGSHDHGSVDPHIWMSPTNVKIISTNICTALSEAYPEHQEVLKKNHSLFTQELDSLDRRIRNAFLDLESRSFMTYHPALSYFARDYQLHQHPMELEGKTPSSAYLKELVDMGKEEGIGVIFLQMQFDQHNAKVLAKEIGAEIVQINPLDPEWYEQMIFISEKIKATL